MTCRQVVNAYQDYCEQDHDLTQKHYFLFRTYGTKQMPRSAVYDGGGGGGGEVLCCRLVWHRSNEATTDARLVFIADEGLGVDPAVEFGGVAVIFHQSLCSSAYMRRCSTNSTGYTLSAGTDTFCRRFVEGSIQHFTEIVDQSVHGWIGGVNLVYR